MLFSVFYAKNDVSTIGVCHRTYRSTNTIIVVFLAFVVTKCCMKHFLEIIYTWLSITLSNEPVDRIVVPLINISGKIHL